MAWQPTIPERREILEFVTLQLARGYRVSQIKTRTVEHFANRFPISRRTVENYLRRARERLLNDSGRPVEEHRAESLAFYREVSTNPEADIKDRIKARERIDKLLCLEVQAKESRGTIVVNVTAEQISQMSDDELDALERRLVGEDQAGAPRSE